MLYRATFFLSGLAFFISGNGVADELPPLGLSELVAPEGNPLTKAKVNLGKKLFFDKTLSRDGTISCASCHDPKAAFAQSGEKTSKGVDEKIGRRNSPSLLNVGFAESLFHDGRSSSLEDQAWQPILADDEMGNKSETEVLERLAKSDEYVRQFKEAFGVESPTKEGVAKALASFQRTLLSGNSAFDRWNWGGDTEALSEEAIEGHDLFAGRALCWQCHPFSGEGILLTDHQFHDTGVATLSAKKYLAEKGESPKEDLGRYEVTKRPLDRQSFKTPSLRNVALTPPYMHDGSIATLREVVLFYKGGGGNGMVQKLDLTDEEVDSIVAFLESLTGDQATE